MPAALRCTRCGVTFYCSKECQTKSWTKGSHKKFCKPNLPRPVAFGADWRNVGGADLDIPVDWVIVPPVMAPFTSRQHFYMSAAIGLESYADLEIFHHSYPTDAKRTDLEPMLIEEFRWATTAVGRECVPGYKWQYDGCAIYAYFDEACRGRTGSSNHRKIAGHPSMGENIVAELVMMVPHDERLYGTVVFGKFSVNSETGEEVNVKLTRREILAISEYNKMCGEGGEGSSSSSAAPAISDRLHFENILRQHQLKELKSQNFQVVDL